MARRRDALAQLSRDRQQQAERIVELVMPWAGSENAAWDLYRTYPIAALRGCTAKQLVEEGRAGDVLAYLSHTASGGYA